MSNNKHSLGFIEMLAILLFILGIIFIFVSGKGKEKQEREIENAIRYQDISAVADSLWKLSIHSTEYTAIIKTLPRDVACFDSFVTVQDFASLLVPSYFEILPQDPSGKMYQVSFDEYDYVTVCSPWGEDQEGNQKLISITR